MKLGIRSYQREHSILLPWLYFKQPLGLYQTSRIEFKVPLSLQLNLQCINVHLQWWRNSTQSQWLLNCITKEHHKIQSNFAQLLMPSLQTLFLLPNPQFRCNFQAGFKKLDTYPWFLSNHRCEFLLFNWELFWSRDGWGLQREEELQVSKW